ncbi:MAG: 4-phosphopantetheinyl transferase [Synechococcus sp. NP17]|nr:4-phosphopantetheinyl transferase [Synechococcus sp. NP17]
MHSYATDREQDWACSLGLTRKKRFLCSRSWMRSCLGHLWGMHALEIPLHAPPGSPPSLPSGWGFLSLSHSSGSALLAWSAEPIGVDLERLDRHFAAQALMSRYFLPAEQERLRALDRHAFQQAVLEYWLIKEAAIKWQQGSLAQDLAHWIVEADGLSACHLLSGAQIYAQRRQLGPWGLAIVSARKQSLTDAMICLN